MKILMLKVDKIKETDIEEQQDISTLMKQLLFCWFSDVEKLAARIKREICETSGDIYRFDAVYNEIFKV